MDKLNKKQIIELLPHRDPMLLIDELYDIKKLMSASAVVNVNVGSATNATVELTDVTGKVVASVSGVSGTTAINTSNVPAGLYVVSVKSAAGVVTSKVVVK